MGIFSEIGKATGITAAGQALGMALAPLNDKRQLNQQKKLSELQMKDNKNMIDYNYDKQYDMWLKTNHAEQVNQMKKAGLNPALMYESGGMGGMTGQPTGSVQGGQASGGAENQRANSEMGMQLGQMEVMKSQVDLNKAQAEKAEAEANKTKGIDTEKGNAETSNLKIDNAFKELSLKIASETEYDAIAQVKDMARKMMHEANIAGVNQVINENTQKDQESKIKSEAVSTAIEVQVKKQGIALDRAKINEITNKIEQAWEDLKITREGQQISRENMQKLTETMLWQAGIQATGNLVNSIIDIKRMNKKTNTKSETITEKFDKNGRPISTEQKTHYNKNY